MTSRVLWTKTILVSLLLLSTAVLLAKRGDNEVIVAHQALTTFPEALDGKWTGHAVGIDPRVSEVLGSGDFAERSYVRDSGEPPVDLFLAYFPSQRTGVTIHSPKNCLPGSGWAPVDAEYLWLSFPGGRRYPINRYVIQKGNQRQLVLYWYQAHNRVVASEYAAKFYLVADSIRMNRSDGALVRIVTPIAEGENAADAQARVLQFADVLMPNLVTYIPA